LVGYNWVELSWVGLNWYENWELRIDMIQIKLKYKLSWNMLK